MVCSPCTAGKSTVDGFPKLLYPESALAASARRFTHGKITKAGRNTLGATGPKNKANASLKNERPAHRLAPACDGSRCWVAGRSCLWAAICESRYLI